MIESEEKTKGLSGKMKIVLLKEFIINDMNRSLKKERHCIRVYYAGHLQSMS